MKKFASLCIIVFVFSYVVATGFFILKTSITSSDSNGQLIARFLGTKPPAMSTIAFAHLADAAAATVRLVPQTTISDDAFTEISPLGASTTITSSAPPASPQISEQTLEIMEATLIHLQMTTGSTVQ